MSIHKSYRRQRGCVSLQCPKCGKTGGAVIASRKRRDGTIYRRRLCLHCRHRFNTCESVDRRALQRKGLV